MYFGGTSEDDIYVQAVTGLNQDILEIHWFTYTKLSLIYLNPFTNFVDYSIT